MLPPSELFSHALEAPAFGGVTNERARSRQRHKKARRSARTSKECADVIDLHAYPGPIEWVDVQDGRWLTILTQPEDCEDLGENISDLSKEEIVGGIASYEHFHRFFIKNYHNKQ